MAQKKGESSGSSLNIQAYIRIRPLTPNEKKSPLLEFARKEITIKNTTDTFRNKILTFDRVFEEDVKQIAVYNAVVQPMIKEVLLGYNCTVFAYGQTGTGKTYTMTGDEGNAEMNFEDNMHAGIIPRTMKDIFDELNNQPWEYQVTISYLELYNEKLRNLLGCPEDDFSNIQLIDDSEGGVLMRGFDATPVKNKDEAFKLLLVGTQKKQTASTNMNNNSSRSHTIFTITVKIREALPGDKEDIVRLGKLHLVDLAGSENVSKSGANDMANKANGVNRRLTEASNINRSLLTLGRVITSITENNPHIPYRESKLTRILRDSLGGRTKTCIIGTISPAQMNLDETESTLNYAYKARSIKNKPEKNRIISKKGFMQGASEEIMKLKRDLEAMRHGNGFYISKETHDEMSLNMKELESQVRMWNERYNTINDKYEEMKVELSNTNLSLDEKCAEYDELARIYTSECERNKRKISELSKVISTHEETIENYKKTELMFKEQVKDLKSVVDGLQAKIERKSDTEDKNIEHNQNFKLNLSTKLDDFENYLQDFNKKEIDFADEVSVFITKMHSNIYEEKDSLIKQFKLITDSVTGFIQETNDLTSQLASDICCDIMNVENTLLNGHSNYKENLICIVSKFLQPIEKIIVEQVAALRMSTQRNQKTLTQFLRDINFSKQEAVKSNETLKFAITSIIQECDALSEKISIEAKERQISAQRSAQKAEMLKAMFQEFVEYTELTQKAEDRTLETLNDYANCTKNIGVNVDRQFSELNTVNDSTLAKCEDICKEIEKTQCNAFYQVLEEFDFLEHNKDEYLVKGIQTVEDNLIVLNARCKTIRSKVMDSLNKVKNTASTFNITHEAFLDSIDDMKSAFKIKEKEYEEALREEHSKSRANIVKVQENKTYVKDQFNEINNFVQDFSYKPYIPIGTTPRLADEKCLNQSEGLTSHVELLQQHTPANDETFVVGALPHEPNHDATFTRPSNLRRSASDSELNELRLFKHPSCKNVVNKTDSAQSLENIEDKENRKRQRQSRKPKTANATKVTPSAAIPSVRRQKQPLSASNKQ